MRSASTFLLLLLGLAGCGHPEEGAVPKVLLIGIDGVRVDIMEAVATPNIDALAAAGTFSRVAQSVQPTVSGPCWSSMLIGVGPDKHGVMNNDFSSNRYSDYPDFLTRIEMMKPELGTFAAVDWLPLGAETDGGPLISDDIDQKILFDGYEFGWVEADSMSVDATIGELLNGNSDALFVYLGAPDEISHVSDGIGREYRDAVETADRHVGRLIEAVKGRANYAHEDWLILVATDHGRTESGDHGGDSIEETTIFYIASGPNTRVGTPASAPSIMDIPVTALAHLGIEIDPSWRLEGKVVGLLVR